MAEIRAVPRDDLVRLVTTALGDDDLQLRDLVALHVDALTTSLELAAPELMAEQVRWEGARLRGLGRGLDPMDVQRAVMRTLRSRLSGSAASRVGLLLGEVAHLVQGRQAAVAAPDQRSAGSVPAEGTAPLPEGAAAYLRAALTLRRTQAVAVVEQALRRGATPTEITLEILQPAQVEVGRLWQAGLITIAQEHFISAVTQTCLTLVAARSAGAARRPGGRLVASAVGSEGHDLGLRMLCELLHGEGWETEFLGAGVPARDLVDVVATVRPEVVALSVTLPSGLASARETIGMLRAEAACDGVRVLLGGRAVDAKPELARLLGADAWAAGPADAIAQCRAWAAPSVDEGPVDEEQVDEAARRDRALAELVRRYGFDERNVEGALELLAAQMRLTPDELVDRLAPPPA